MRWDSNDPSANKEKNVYDDEDVYQVILDYEKNKRELLARVNQRRCSTVPMYGEDFRESVTINAILKNSTWNNGYTNCVNTLYGKNVENTTQYLKAIVHNPEHRIQELNDVFNRYVFEGF